MSGSDGVQRPWRQIAKELSEENDPQRVLELSIELNAALAVQGANLMDVDLPATPGEPADGH